MSLSMAGDDLQKEKSVTKKLFDKNASDDEEEEGDEIDKEEGDEDEEDDSEATEKEIVDDNGGEEEEERDLEDLEDEDERESTEKKKIVDDNGEEEDENDASGFDDESDASSNTRPRHEEKEEEDGAAPSFVSQEQGVKNQMGKKDKTLPFYNDDDDENTAAVSKKKKNKNKNKKKKKRSHREDAASQEEKINRKRKRKAKENAHLPVHEEEEEEESGKKAPIFHRLWSDEHELLLLQTMADYKSKTGMEPSLGKTSSFMEDCFSTDAGGLLNNLFSKQQIFNKIRTCRRKFLNNLKNKKNLSFRTPNQKKVFDLLNNIWSEEEDKKKKKQILPPAVTGNGNDDGVSWSLEQWYSEGLRNVECPQERQKLEKRWIKCNRRHVKARHKLLQVVSDVYYLAQQSGGGGIASG